MIVDTEWIVMCFSDNGLDYIRRFLLRECLLSLSWKHRIMVRNEQRLSNICIMSYLDRLAVRASGERLKVVEPPTDDLAF